MNTTRKQLEDQLVQCCRALHQRGWVANHDGNATVRLDGERTLASPTGVSKRLITRDTLLVVDAHGQRISGRTKPFSEISLHLYVYRHRSDVNAVLHAHPPKATGMAVAGVEILPTLMAEPVVSLGAKIPLVSYACPKSAEFTTHLSPHVLEADALLLENHGVLTYGPDLETAFLRMELVEHLASIQLAAMQAGGLRTIPQADLQTLLEARAAAGLARK